MKKFLMIFAIIFTFGLVLFGSSAKCFSASQLDNANRFIGYDNSSTTWQLYFSTDNLDSGYSYYVGIQFFHKDNLNVPVRYSAITSNVAPQLYLNGTLNNMNENTSSGNYGYRSASVVPTTNTSYITLFNPGTWWNNYVINITMNRSTTALFGSVFIPNTFYDIEGLNNQGFFQYTKTYLLLSGTQNSPVDTTSYFVRNGIIKLNDYTQTIYNNNNRDTNQYYMRVVFDSGYLVKDMPNFTLSYLEIASINVNGASYTYSNALNNFSWLYNNITMYNDNATLFVNNDNTSNDIIYSIDFNLPNYSFKSSTYYNSNVGLLGYLKGVKISVFSNTQVYDYNLGYEDGLKDGYTNGYSEGYLVASEENVGSFDNLMFSVAQTPITIITGLLNFEILGFNLLGFFMGIITLMLFIYLFRKFKE